MLTFTGFNMYYTTSDTIVLGGASQTLPGASTTSGFVVTAPTTTRSGAVTLTVNAVPSLNNSNSNTVEYNTEIDVTNSDSDLWNDDRNLHVWRSNDNQTGANRGYFAGSSDPEYPAMAQNAGVLYASWSNYATSSVFRIANNEDYVFATHRIASSYDPLEQTDIAYGNRPGVIYNANTYGNGLWNYAGAGGIVVWDANANGADNVSTGNGYEVEYLYHDRRLMQFTGQRLAYQGDNIHAAYFDTETKALKYWYTANGGNVGYSARWINIDGGYDAHDGDYQERYGRDEWTGASITNIAVANGASVVLNQIIMTDSDGINYRAPVAGVVDIAIALGARISGTNTTNNQSILFSVRTSTNRVVDVAGSSRSAAAGEFCAIDTTPTNNFPVIAYYDITNRTVKIARATAVNPAAAQWNLQTVMSLGDLNYNFSGKYISMKVDTLGYVHLAFYRNSTGDLIYMKSTNNPTNGATAYTFGPSVIVDAAGSVGIWADITLVNNRPWISYLDSSYTYSFDGLKVAYYDPAFEAEIGDAAGEPDTRDGWEYMNAALVYEVENVRTSIEPDGGANFWGVALGYSSSDFYRIAYYVD
ncbi:hypothetical protein EH220_03725 [bacterium]|nr:MAG: hypothetical protein EH220_03725 [bacterium]